MQRQARLGWAGFGLTFEVDADNIFHWSLSSLSPGHILYSQAQYSTARASKNICLGFRIISFLPGDYLLKAIVDKTQLRCM